MLLYASTSALAGRAVLYGCTVFCGSSAAPPIVPTIAAAIEIAMVVLPSLIAAMCQSWQGAAALAVLPWWLTVIARAGALLRLYLGLGGTGGPFDPPF